MMKLVFLAFIVIVWIQLAQIKASHHERGGKRHKRQGDHSSSSPFCFPHFGYQDIEGYYHGNEDTCLDDVVVPGIPSLTNIGCYSDADLYNTPLIHYQLPAQCAYISPDRNCSRPGYQNVADIDWEDVYFLRHPKEDLEGIVAVVRNDLATANICLRNPFVCYVGTRFVDLSFVDGYGLYCLSYTAHGECANNSMLANSTQFLTLSGTDKTGLISAALTYATGGKRLHNLCVIDFNPETQGPL